MEKLTREEHPHYQEAVRLYLAGDSKRLEVYLSQAHLRSFEKSLIKVRWHLKAAEPNEALALLLGLSAAPSVFLEAEKMFLQASSEFQKARFEEAARWNLEAIALYETIRDRRGQFLCHYNVSADFNRLGLEVLSYRHLQRARDLAADSSEEVLVLRAMACHESNEENFSEANQLVDQALAALHDLNAIDQAITLNVAADIRFRSGNWRDAEELLKKARRSRWNREPERTDFELLVLEKLLVGEQRLGKPSSSVGDSPEYALKWKILRSLQSGELLEASQLWKQLVRQSPDDYSADFQCKNASLARGIFMTAVSRLMSSEKLQTFNNLALGKTRLEYLELLLRSSPMPLRKEELIEKVWKTDYSPDLDSRFYRLISRLKRQNGMNILCVNRAYSLSKS